MSNGVIDTPPPNLHPVTITHQGGNIIHCDGYDSTTTNNSHFAETLSQESTSWLLQNVDKLDHIRSEWLTEGMTNGLLIAVCDGSYQPALSKTMVLAAWRIEANPCQYICGKATTAGHAADAYRGELPGIYGLLTLIQFAESVCPLYTKGHIQIGCVNKSAGWMSGD